MKKIVAEIRNGTHNEQPLNQSQGQDRTPEEQQELSRLLRRNIRKANKREAVLTGGKQTKPHPNVSDGIVYGSVAYLKTPQSSYSVMFQDPRKHGDIKQKLRRMYKNIPKVADDAPDPLEALVIAEIDEEEEGERSSSPSASIKSMTDLNWPQEAEGILTQAD